MARHRYAPAPRMAAPRPLIAAGVGATVALGAALIPALGTPLEPVASMPASMVAAAPTMTDAPVPPLIGGVYTEQADAWSARSHGPEKDGQTETGSAPATTPPAAARMTTRAVAPRTTTTRPAPKTTTKAAPAPAGVACSTTLAGTRPWVARAGRYLLARFGVPVGSVLGLGGRTTTDSDHPKGLALDFVIGTQQNAKGDALAAYVLANRARLGVTYVIWRQRINTGTGWVAMADRGSITANHYDHVHVSFSATAPTAAPFRC